MEDNSKKRLLYSYYIETREGEIKRCCGPVWEFAYGVSSTTKKRASTRGGTKKPTSSSKRLGKEKRKQGLNL
jgi:hypothetical protein